MTAAPQRTLPLGAAATDPARVGSALLGRWRSAVGVASIAGAAEEEELGADAAADLSEADLHAFPCEDNEDAAYLTGRAVVIDDPARRAVVEQQVLAERAAIPIPPESLAAQTLFRLDITRCLVTTTTGHGDSDPHHDIWRA